LPGAKHLRPSLLEETEHGKSIYNIPSTLYERKDRVGNRIVTGAGDEKG